MDLEIVVVKCAIPQKITIQKPFISLTMFEISLLIFIRLYSFINFIFNAATTTIACCYHKRKFGHGIKSNVVL